MSHTEDLPDSKPQKLPRFIRSYGRRKGRGMKLDEAEMIAAGELDFVLPLEEPSAFNAEMEFGFKPQQIWLEIGSGSGENIIFQAEKNPQIALIGCEPYYNGVEITVRQLKKKKLENVRMYAGDARFLIERFPDNSIDRVFILYPDPWPKKRHNNRRIINTQTLNMLHRVMKTGAILRTATDHPDYAEWILLKTLENKKFKWTAESAKDFNNPPPDWCTTKYEQKRLAGKPTYLDFLVEK